MIFYYFRNIRKFCRMLFCKNIIKIGDAWVCTLNKGLFGFYRCEGLCPNKRRHINKADGLKADKILIDEEAFRKENK